MAALEAGLLGKAVRAKAGRMHVTGFPFLPYSS